jgi:uncharacterized glyoxalase superfamily protein PhnB
MTYQFLAAKPRSPRRHPMPEIAQIIPIFKTTDVTALREALIQRGGAPEDTQILEQSWGTREIYLTDPDGNRLRFGQRE